MEKNVEISLLLSFYKNMLTERQADTVELYYNEDLSLSEVGAELGISRQGVRDNLKRAEAILYDVESKLGLAARFIEIKSKLGEIDHHKHPPEIFLQTYTLHFSVAVSPLHSRDRISDFCLFVQFSYRKENRPSLLPTHFLNLSATSYRQVELHQENICR